MKWIFATVVFLASRLAAAQVCPLTIDATDQMRFEQQTLQIEPGCTEVEVTLHNRGKVMGHDWVLTKTADVASVATAGMAAGPSHNYQKPGDSRILAATGIVGGGESGTVRFSTAQLDARASYSYFCSAPGHFSIMRGRFVMTAAGAPALAAVAPETGG
ncbi:MAG: azurin [Steroidobacteraceae bacterium]